MITLGNIRTLGKLCTPKAQFTHSHINSLLYNYISDKRRITISYTFIHNNIIYIYIFFFYTNYFILLLSLQ